MTVKCPHRGHPEYQALEKELGPERAFIAWKRNGEDIPSMDGAKALLIPGLTVHRAGDASEHGIKPWSSWSEDEAIAKAYMDNPGFGGETLRSEIARIDPSKILDADTTNRNGMRNLAKALGFDEERGENWFDSGYRYPWEEDVKVKKAIEDGGFHAIRYTDDFPPGAKTITFTNNAPIVERAREVLSQQAKLGAPATSGEAEEPEPGTTEPKPSPGPTSIKNAEIDADRVRRGLPERFKPVSRGFGKVWDAALKVIDGSERDGKKMAGTDLVDSLKDTIRPINDTEDAILTHEQLSRQQSHDDAMKAIAAATKAGDADALEKAHQWEARALDAVYEVYEVGQRAGTENARGLNARKLAIAQDYSLTALLNQKRAVNYGKRLSPEQLAATQKSATGIAQARVVELEKENASLRAQLEADHATLKKDVASGKVKPSQAGGKAKQARTMAEKARALLQKMGALNAPSPSGKLEAAAPDVDPEIAQRREALSHVGAYHYSIDADETAWRSAMEAEFGDRIAASEWEGLYEESRAAYEAIPETTGDTPAEIAKGIDYTLGYDPASIRDLAMSHIMAGHGDTVDALLDALHKDLDQPDRMEGITKRDIADAISGYGKTSQPSANKNKKQLTELSSQMRLLSQLEDAQKGKPPLKTGFQRGAASDKVRALQKQVGDLIKKIGIKVTDPAKHLKTSLDAAKTRLRNQITDLTDQIAAGKRTAKRAGFDYDDEAKTLKAESDRLREALREMEGTRPGMSDEQRLKIAVNALDKSVNTREEALDIALATVAAGGSWKDAATKIEAVMKKRGKVVTVDPEELSNKKARRDELNDLLAGIKEAADPSLTPEQKALTMVKRRVASEMEKVQKKIDTKDYAKKTPAQIKADDELVKARADLNRKRLEWRRDIEKDRLAKRSKPEKAKDWALKYARFSLISGINVIGKLFTAANARFVTEPTRQAIGGGLALIPGISQIAERSPRRWGFSAAAEGEALAKAWIGFYKNAGARLKTGKADWEINAQSALHKDDYYDLDKSWMDYAGHLHMLLKSPAVEREYAASLAYRIAWAMHNGIDVTAPEARIRLEVAAYTDSLRAKLMQDNAMVSAYQSALRTMEQKGGGGKGAATALRLLLPIVKIPTNYVGEAVRHTPVVSHVLSGIEIYHAYREGIDKLTEDQADVIMRHLSQGALGTAVTALGFFLSGYIGGYYQDREKRKPGDVAASRLRVGNWDVPRFMTHTPLLEALQFGSTLDRVMNAETKKGSGEKKGFTAAALAGLVGLGEEIPFGRLPADLLTMVNAKGSEKGSEARARFIGSRVVPAALADTAGYIDPANRVPHSIMEGFKVRIPGLKSTVPEKKPAHRARALWGRSSLGSLNTP